MRNLVVVEFLTLDGVMQGPGEPDEDPSGGFEHSGWQQAYFDDTVGAAVLGGLERTGGFLHTNAPVPLRLVESTSSSSGVQINRYEPA